MDHQQSGSWNHERDEGEDEQVLQPKTTGKRSRRGRPKCAIERLEGKSSNERGSMQLLMQVDHDYDLQSRNGPEFDSGSERHDLSASSLGQRRNLPPRTSSHVNMQKSSRLNYLPAEDIMDHSREKWNGKAISSMDTSPASTKMSDGMQRKVCVLLLMQRLVAMFFMSRISIYSVPKLDYLMLSASNKLLLSLNMYPIAWLRYVSICVLPQLIHKDRNISKCPYPSVLVKSIIFHNVIT